MPAFAQPLVHDGGLTSLFMAPEAFGMERMAPTEVIGNILAGGWGGKMEILANQINGERDPTLIEAFGGPGPKWKTLKDTVRSKILGAMRSFL